MMTCTGLAIKTQSFKYVIATIFTKIIPPLFNPDNTTSTCLSLLKGIVTYSHNP